MLRLRILPSAIATFAFGVLVIAGCTLGAPAGNSERGGGTDVEGTPPLADEVPSPLADEVPSPPAGEVPSPPAGEVPSPLADEVTVAKNHAVVIQTVADDADERDIVALFVIRAPAHGQAEPWGELAVRYAPTRHFTGVDEFRYRLVSAEGELETVVVTVHVVNEDWVVVAGRPLLLWKVDVPSADEESGTTVTDVTTGGSIVGYTGPPSQPRGFLRWAGHSEFELPDLFDGQPFVFAHADVEGQVAGVLIRQPEGDETGFVWQMDGGAPQLWQVDGAHGTRLHAVHGAQAVGTLIESRETQHGVLVTGSLDHEPSIETIDTPGGTSLEILGLGADETMVGVYETETGRRGFRRPGISSDVHPDEAIWSEAHDFGGEDLVVGTAAWPINDDADPESTLPEVAGFIHRAVEQSYERFDVPLALETHLVGASGVSRLTGSFIDTDGRLIGFVTEAVDLPEGQQVESLLDDPAHSSVGNHVCAHTITGPFDELEAADSDRAPLPSIAEAHTSYAVSLPTADGGYGGWLTHQTLLGGRLTFYLSHHVLFRLSDAEGATIAPVLVDVSSSCAGIKRFFQYELPQEFGEYTVQLSRALVPVVHLILEKGWVHEDVGH